MNGCAVLGNGADDEFGGREFYKNKDLAAIERSKFNNHHDFGNISQMSNVSLIKIWVCKFEEEIEEI